MTVSTSVVITDAKTAVVTADDQLSGRVHDRRSGLGGLSGTTFAGGQR